MENLPITRQTPIMPTAQEQFDDAMFAFSTGDCEGAIAQLRAILTADPGNFEAQLALGGALYAKGDYPAAIAEGHTAEKMRPQDQWVHTNLSRAYMKAGNRGAAEHHAAQARIASWRGNMTPPAQRRDTGNELPLAPPGAA
jgi:predicted Zn-dependent protease